MGEGSWEVVDWLVEIFSKNDVFERDGKLMYFLIETTPKSEMGNRRRESFHLVVKFILEDEVCERGR